MRFKFLVSIFMFFCREVLCPFDMSFVKPRRTQHVIYENWIFQLIFSQKY